MRYIFFTNTPTWSAQCKDHIWIWPTLVQLLPGEAYFGARGQALILPYLPSVHLNPHHWQTTSKPVGFRCTNVWSFITRCPADQKHFGNWLLDHEKFFLQWYIYICRSMPFISIPAHYHVAHLRSHSLTSARSRSFRLTEHRALPLKWRIE